MNDRCNEDLVGYLLGALEADEQARIEQRLEEDAELRRQLMLLDEQLHAIRGDVNDFDPPPRLLKETCDVVADFEQQRKVAMHGASGNAPRSSGWSLIDSIVAAGVCLSVALLFFPAIASSRHAADVSACQDNLRNLGVALCDYSAYNQDRYPEIPTQGNTAAAGFYGPVLVENQLVADQGWFVCPSSSLAEDKDAFYIPTRDELLSATGQRLLLLQQTMGGSYAYSLGYTRNGRYYPTRHQGRAYFVIMADAPSRHLPGRRSANHGGCGQNALFDDLHVSYVVGCALSPSDDGFYENRNGQIAPGIGVDDAVVGGSSTSPVVFFGQ